MLPINRIDSHQHFWALERGDYSWLTPELEILYQDFLPKHLAAELVSNRVSKTILVQAADTIDETHYLLDIAQREEFVAGVVGWVSLDSPYAVNELIELKKNPFFKGVRPMLQDIDDVDWILQKKVKPALRFLAENNLTFDALVTSKHLKNIEKIAKEHPTLKIVIDHCAKPNVSELPSDRWCHDLTAVAKCSNVFIKFSGLITEAPIGNVQIAQIQPFFKHILRIFGPYRILWGSDWPVIKLNGEYDSWVAITHALTAELSLSEKEHIWSKNTKKFYNITD